MRLDQMTQVKWRGTTNCSGEQGMGISFSGPEGEVIRLHLSIAEAAKLAGSMSEFLLCYLAATHSQSPTSAEIPKPAVSPQDGVKV